MNGSFVHRVDVTVRPATLGDYTHLYLTYVSTRLEELAAVRWSATERDAFLWMQFEAQERHYRTHHDGCRFDVIELGGRPAGRLYVARGPAEIRIVEIALLPAHRGRGIGTLLIEELLDEGRRRGLPVAIQVERGNRARSLYERLGFNAIRETGAHTRMQADPARVEVRS